MKNLLFTAICILGMSLSSYAQEYESAIGARLGSPLSLSYKKFVSESNAIELYGGLGFGTGFSSFSANGAYLLHKPLDAADGLSWYYGAGAGIAFFTFRSTFLGSSGGATVNAQGYLGLDYKVSDIPLNLSIDIVPTFGVTGFRNGLFFGGAVAARYILGQE